MYLKMPSTFQLPTLHVYTLCLFTLTVGLLAFTHSFSFPSAPPSLPPGFQVRVCFWFCSLDVSLLVFTSNLSVFVKRYSVFTETLLNPLICDPLYTVHCTLTCVLPVYIQNGCVSEPILYAHSVVLPLSLPLPLLCSHNRRTTTWEDPRKMMHGVPGHPHQPQIPTSMQLPMHQQHPMMSQFPSGPPPPAPHLPHHRMPPYQQGGGTHLDTPLPNGWEKSFTPEGEVFYVNHKSRTTSWLHPGHHSPHHQHSHSLVNMAGGGHPNFLRGGGHFRQNSPGGAGMTLSQHLQTSGDLHNRSPQTHQRFPSVPIEHIPVMGGEPKQVPTTMYGDPILSSEHVRSSSHDSGLGGPTNFPYASETPMMGEYDESMDTSGAISGMKFPAMGGMRGGAPNHRSLEYLDIGAGEVEPTFPDPNAGAMETELLPGPLSGEVFNETNIGQWV